MIVSRYRDGTLANLVHSAYFERVKERERDIAWWHEASPEQVKRYAGK